MSQLSPRVVQVDDIVIRQLPAGHYALTAQPAEFHCPHLCLALLVCNGQLFMEDAHQEKLLINGKNNVLIAPWKSYNLKFSESLLSIDFPSYRLNACSLMPLWRHHLSDEQCYLLDTMTREILSARSLPQPSAQRFVANALSTMVALPEPEERSHDIDGNYDSDVSLRATIARVMRERMHEPHLRAEDVTGNLCISRAQLYRILSPFGGFKTCLHAQRLDEVARRLKNPADDSLSIKALLFRNGFSSTEQFQRLFYKRFNISARDFRRGTHSENGIFSRLHGISPCLQPAKS